MLRAPFRLPCLNECPCWLLLDADWFPSAITTPFTAAGPEHIYIVSLSQLAAAYEHGIVLHLDSEL